MKNSGIEWIGEIPDSWKLVNIGNVLKEHKQENKMLDTRALQFKYGTIVPKKELNLTQDALDILTKYNVVSPNIIMVNGLNLAFDFVTQRVALVKENGVITSTYIALAPQELIVPEYATYTLKAFDSQKVFHSLGRGLRCMLSYDVIKREKMPLPSLAVQRSIVNCLVQKLGEVDKLIEVQQAQIDKLKEYKQSVITEAVTKGLDPTVPMKDSGVEWIGMIPEGWEIRRGKNVVDLLNKPVYNTDDVITCFRDGEVTLRKNRREEGFTFSDKEIGYQGIDVGDLVIHGMDGFAGAIGISDSRGKGSPVLIVLDSKQNKKFLMYYLRSLAYRDIFLALSTGIRVRSCDLRWNKISTLPFLIPSLEEQYGIVKYIEKRLYDIDKLIAIKQAKIDKLQEYKKSLIYEYVTGKKEVV